MNLEGDHSTEVTLLDLVIVDVNGLHSVDLMDKMVSYWIDNL